MDWNHWAGLGFAVVGILALPWLIWKASKEPFFWCRNCGAAVSELRGRSKSELRRDHEKVCFVD